MKHRRARSPQSRRTPLHAFVSALLGAATGLAAAGVVVASAPVVGGSATTAADAATRDSVVGGPRGPAVSAVLAPAATAGIVATPEPEAAQP